MAFLKENLNAFLDQPVERKRSDHRLKKADSVVDTRAWVLNEDLKRQQFLNVVNQTGEVGAGVGDDFSEPRSRHLTPEHSDLEVGEKFKKLNEEKDFLRNVIADKENEIERLLLRIQTMAEVGESGVGPTDSSDLKKQLNDMIKQYNAKEDELKKTKDLLNNTEKMLKDLQTLVESTGEDPEKQKKQLDNIMKGLQTGMQDDIEQLQNTVRELEERLKNADNENAQMRSELEAMASGDENELNKIIMGLKTELDKVKMSKDAENEALKETVSKKEDEVKALKNMLNQQNKDQINPLKSPEDYSTIDIENLKEMLNERDNLIALLKDELENEKRHNNALKEDLNLLAESDDNALKNKILALTAELENLRSKPSAASYQPEERGKPETVLATTERLEDKIRDLENLLQLEKELSDKLKKEVANEKEKYNKLASADDDEVKRMLADAEKQIEELNKDKETKEKLIKSLETEDKKPLASLETKESDKQIPNDYEQLKKENIELQDENNKLIKKIKDLQEQKFPENIDDLIKENEILKRENKALNNENDILKGYNKEQDNTAVTSKFPDISTEVDKEELIKINNELKNELEAMKRRIPFYSQTEPILTPKPGMVDEEEMEKKLNQLQKENERLKSNMKEEKDKYNETIADKDKQMNSLQDKLNKMQKENEKLLSQAEKQTDGQQLGSDNSEIDSLKKKINQLESQNTALSGEKDYCNENLKTLRDDMKKLQEENGNLEKLVNNLKGSPPKTQSTPLQAEDSSDQKFQKCIQDKQKLEAELDQLKKTLAYNQKDEEQSKLPVTKLQEKEEELKSEDISLLRDENKKVKAANERLKQDIERLKQELEALKKEGKKPVPETALEKESKRPEDMSKELKEDNIKLKAKVKELEDKIAKIQSSPPEVQSMAPKEKVQTDTPVSIDPQLLIKEKNENLKLAKDNKDLNNEISDLKKQLNESQRKNLELEKDNEKYLNLLNNAEGTGGVTSDSLLDICKNNLEKLKKENSNLKERIASLEKDLNKKKIIDSTLNDGGLLPVESAKAEENKSDNIVSGPSKLKEYTHDSPSDKKPTPDTDTKTKKAVEQEGPKSQTKPGQSSQKDFDAKENNLRSKEETPKEQYSTGKVAGKSEEPLTSKTETKGKENLNQKEIDENINKTKKEMVKEQPSTLKKAVETSKTGTKGKQQLNQEEIDENVDKTKKEVVKEQPSTLKKAVETSKTETKGKQQSNQGKIDENIDKNKKEIVKEQPSNLKKAVEKNDAPSTLKKDTPKAELDHSIKVDGVVKTLDSKRETPKEQFTKKSDTDKSGKPLTSKQESSKEHISTKKEDVGVKPSEKVTPKDKPVKAKDVLDKKKETEVSKTPETAAISRGKTATTQESIQGKKEPKQDIETSKIKPQEKEAFVDTVKTKAIAGKLAAKDGKILPGKENIEPKESVPIDKDKTEAVDSQVFPKKDMAHKRQTQSPGFGQDKKPPEKSKTHLKEEKKSDFDQLQKESTISEDGKVLSTKHAVDKPQIKEKAKSGLAKGVKDSVDLTSGKEKAKKRKREVIEEKKEKDYDGDHEGQAKYKPSRIKETKAKKTGGQPKDEVLKEVGDSRQMHESDVFEAQKHLETGSQGFGDKELDNELNEIKKKLFEAEKLIKELKNENLTLQMKLEALKQIGTPREDKMDKFEDKFLDEDAKKLNKILRKAINQGLKTLYLNELEYLHDSLNNTMADRLNRPQTPGTKSPEELERLISHLEQRIASLLGYLKVQRQFNEEQSGKILQYSQKVQQLNTDLGMQKMNIESVLMQNHFLRELLSSEKEKVKNLENMLRNVLDNCKCTRKGVLNQYYHGLKET